MSYQLVAIPESLERDVSSFWTGKWSSIGYQQVAYFSSCDLSVHNFTSCFVPSWNIVSYSQERT